jgi:hypothetical protein
VPILYAEIQVLGRQVPCARVSFSFVQPTDEKGRPSSTVRVERLKVVLVGEPAGWGIWEELKFDEFRRVSGRMLFFEGEGQTARRYTFYDAALVWLEFRYDGKGTGSKQAATQVELHFSPATVEVDGQRIEAHSVIPWETDPQTSFRALTKPPEPQPSAHLAALLATVKLKAEELGTGLLKRVITPAGEVATEFLGVGLAAIARTASLTVGLVLTPTNSPDDPGYKSEWDMIRRNARRGTPLTKDQIRLINLEHLLEERGLTEAEEAEMIALLAKVRGIHVQRLDQLTEKPPYAPIPTKWKEKGGRVDVLPNGNWKYTDWEGETVVYEGDEPNFDHKALQQVNIEDMQGNCTTDFIKANKAAPLGPKKPGNTWHHKQNLKTMQEVPYKVHKRFSHYGARSIFKQQAKAASSPKKAVPAPKKPGFRKKKP